LWPVSHISLPDCPAQGVVILYMECRPLPSFAHVCALCTFSNISAAASSWICQKLAAEQLLGRADGTVRHGRRFGPPITVQIIVLHSLFSSYRQDRTPCWANSLWPSASVGLPDCLAAFMQHSLNEFKLGSSRLQLKRNKWGAGEVVFAFCTAHFYTVKKVSDFPVPSRDVTKQNLPGRE
jgi:hypothetical protein